MRALRKLVLGETVGAAGRRRARARRRRWRSTRSAGSWWEDGGGFILLALVVAVLAVVARSRAPAALRGTGSKGVQHGGPAASENDGAVGSSRIASSVAMRSGHATPGSSCRQIGSSAGR